MPPPNSRLCLLGTPRLESADGPRSLPLDRPASLGFHLAQRGDWVRRAELAYLYSPEADESAALANLRKLAHRLRQQGWAEGLEADMSRLRLCLPTDVQDFRAALARHDWPLALQHYAGPFLAGLALHDLSGYDAWLEIERQDLARAWRSALIEQVRTLEARAEWVQAEHWLTRLLGSDALDEDAAQALMRVLHAAGKPAQARAVFERLRQGLADELGVEPTETTLALADSLRGPAALATGARQGPPFQPPYPPPHPPLQPHPPLPPESDSAAAPPAPPVPPRHNLPTVTTRFFGRRHELEALARQLRHPDCRLLTVMGLGGMGKTRVALELAAQQVAGFADGVWLAPLSETPRSDLLVAALAGAVGLVFNGPADPRLQLLNYLRGKHLLLVLDNFEHLLDGSPLLEELLAQAPGLKLLVTSRVALQTPSEWPFDLDGLACPPPGCDEALDDFDAVRLFIGRAERFSSRFALTPAALRDVAELTRQLEGMPLALELAATWVRGLSVGEILKQLRQGFALLQAAGPGVPPRQRNLQALIDHSWQLLSSAEQAALARLSLFRGGFGLEAAQCVAGAHLGLLLRFINQALVRRVDEARYDLHELVRQFAEQRLGAADRAAALARFSDHFHDQLLALGQAARFAIQPDTVVLCRRELGNICLALDHLAAHGEPGRLAKVLTSFQVIIETAGLFKVGLAQLDGMTTRLEDRALQDARPGADEPQDRLLRGGLEAVKAYCLIKLGRDQEAAQLAEAAITRLTGGKATAAVATESDFLGIAHGAVGLCHHMGGRFEAAAERYGQALAIFERLRNRSEQCRVLNRLATTMCQLDRYDESNRLYEQALAIATTIGDLTEQATLLNNHGINFESNGQIDEAMRRYEASLAIAERLQLQRVWSAALTNLGHVHERQRDLPAARRRYEQSLAIKRVIGEPVAIAISLTNLADVLYALGDDAAGHRSNFEAMAQTRAAHARLYTARVLWSFCKYLRAQAATEPALRLACFLGQSAECEQWVRDEAEQLIAGAATEFGAAALDPLRTEARGLDHDAVFAWLQRQACLQLDDRVIDAFPTTVPTTVATRVG